MPGEKFNAFAVWAWRHGNAIAVRPIPPTFGFIARTQKVEEKPLHQLASGKSITENSGGFLPFPRASAE